MPIEHAIADLLHRDCRERSLEGGLPQHAIAAHGCEQSVPRPHGDRKIVSGNHAHQPQRMPLLVHAMLRALTRHRKAVELTGKTDGEIRDVYHFLNLAFSLSENLPHFERHQHAEIIFEQTQLFADFTHDLATLGSRKHTPSLEYFDGLRHNFFVIDGSSQADARELLAG